MSSKLTEAAERLRRVEAGEPLLDVYPWCREKPKMRVGVWGVFEMGEYAKSCIEADRENLADAYLAEHPVDDAEPVTGEWLRSVGFNSAHRIPLDDGFELHAYPEMDMDWDIYFFNGEAGGELSISEPKTRGDVRKLCAALGIELEETA